MMNVFSHVPPGFRFHPTDEELVDYYLRKKISNRRIDLDVIKDVDLYKIEPWDLEDLCRIGTDEENEWYFFSHKDKKYPTGTRTNRATVAGFWKATGRDKSIYRKHELIGMRKTLVFYKGRAPNGLKSDWIMHEYRLETDENGASQEEGWVVCRVFKKRITTVQKMNEHDTSHWYDDRMSFISDLDSSKRNNINLHNHNLTYHILPYPYKKEIDLHYQFPQNYLNLPLQTSKTTFGLTRNPIIQLGLDFNHPSSSVSSSVLREENSNQYQMVDQVMDWKFVDNFVAAQLSQQDTLTNNVTGSSRNEIVLDSSDETDLIAVNRSSDKREIFSENTLTSSSSCHIDLYGKLK